MAATLPHLDTYLSIYIKQVCCVVPLKTSQPLCLSGFNVCVVPECGCG